VLCPEPEVGSARVGASATFLENAEDYYARHQGFEYWHAAFRNAFQHLGLSRADLIVEYGCGFGNATLPLLEMFPGSIVLATDISPNLLAILKRLIDARGLEDRCVPVALDAHKPYIKPGIADVVAGSAVLHHLADPGAFLKAAMRVLKPGGVAVFFEPFEVGHALLRLLIRELSREAAVREASSPALSWLAEMAVEFQLQTKRDLLPGWHDLDDKWLFTRSHLQRFADQADAELLIRAISPESFDKPFRNTVTNMIRDWRRLDPGDLTNMPPWAWNVIDYYDAEAFSSELKEDLLFEGCVIFRKRAR
jgi:SAM-dependent methyltransferase